MDEVRYAAGLIMIMTVPISLGVWLLIHPFARIWRRIGLLGTYGVIAPVSAVLGIWLWSNQQMLLGTDLGMHPILMGLAIAAFTAALAVARVRRRQLTPRILTGIAELSRDKGCLLTQGVYARTRNPRYLELLLSVLGFVSIANHVGTWVLWVLCFPGVHIVVLLEERELRDRFGAEYEHYCERVPRYLPKWS